MSVDSLDQALEHANSSRYGLSAYLFTNDYRAAMRAAQGFQSGEIYINRTHGEAFQAHHIGHGDSGVGGEDGKYGVLKYTQLKTVYHRFG
jgi:lactaldehyde dehydrogenase/glycolaldehyde dehydrogenase